MGDSGNDPNYPDYNTENVLSSPAGKAIDKVMKNVDSLKKENVLKLRQYSTINCYRNISNKLDCSAQCLFDIENDPCESNDISNHHSEVSTFSSFFIGTSLIKCDSRVFICLII